MAIAEWHIYVVSAIGLQNKGIIRGMPTWG